MVALRLVAPGTQLREGLDRILQARMGALIVIGDGPEVLSVCSGGFLLDAEFTPQRLSELAKMDGAIILASDGSRVARANVHLVPDPEHPHVGDRHPAPHRRARRAPARRPGDHRVGRHVASSRSTAAARSTRSSPSRACSPAPTRRSRSSAATRPASTAVSGSLSALEVEDLVTVRDVATVLQRAEMVRRIAEEIEGYVVELGADGRLVMLQLEELVGGVEDDRRLVAKDYFQSTRRLRAARRACAVLADLDDETLLDLNAVAAVLHLGPDVGIDSALQPRGFRLLHKIPRLPEIVSDHVVDRFSNLQKIMRAGLADLTEVEGVGEVRARAIKEGLSRLAETSILERYVLTWPEDLAERPDRTKSTSSTSR